MYRTSFLKVGLLYALSAGLLTYYGIAVCPFLESLTVRELFAILACAFVVAGICRFLILNRIAVIGASNRVNLQKPWHFLLIDLSMWVLTGLLVTGWNVYWFDFPFGSGMKVVLGCVTLGIFSATYLALEVEKELILCLAEEDRPIETPSGKFFSITTKFMVFVVLAVAVVTGVLLLMIYKDFSYVIDVLSHDKPFEFLWVVREIVFVFAVLLFGSFVVARQYSRNLQLMFTLQLKAFTSVEKGDFEAFVPVVRHDEFGLIAQQTNQMIAGLKQKARIEKAFGKYMSPAVAEAVLNSEQETHLGGREVHVAVLFTDLRDFTPLAEQCTPEEVVNILNVYFTMVVDAVHRHNGVLDKFMGDAAMAVYGLDGADAHDSAVKTAFDLIEGLTALNARLASEAHPTLRNGIGIHYGSVVAGNIGSEERLEYTVIGDAVNTAARLEKLTKDLPSVLAVSSEVYGRVSPALRMRLTYLQDFALKGKATTLPVYGLKENM